jgi:predicted phosphodiesterase
VRVFALSDLHVDYEANRLRLEALSRHEYRSDVLIVAGDVSDDLERLEATLTALRERFGRVFFVPGNHELWVRRRECADSFEKFVRLVDLCAAIDVSTRPQHVGGDGGAWIVPLFSWYVKPEEGPDSLFIEKRGEDPSLSMWADNHFVRWPDQDVAPTPADRFLLLNEPFIERDFDAPVISFSHFLPRADLIRRTRGEIERLGPGPRDRHPEFNFSRVAGSAGIERQIRRLGSRVHVYGHQHRDRTREIDGVRYVSRCLGYPKEGARLESTPDPDLLHMVWTLASPPGESTGSFSSAALMERG